MMASPPNKRFKLENAEDAAGGSSSASDPVDGKNAAGCSSSTWDPVDDKNVAGCSSGTSDPVDGNNTAGCSSSTSDPVDGNNTAGCSSSTWDPVGGKNVAGCSSSTSESVLPELQEINDTSDHFSVIVRSGAFVDKTLLIKSMFMEKSVEVKEQSGEEMEEESVEEMRKVLITAPKWFGKSVNMNMLKTFFEIEVDNEGNPKICVKRNEAGKWIEDDEKTPTENFKIFKDNNLQIYRCHCTLHSIEEISKSQCNNKQCLCELKHSEEEICEGKCNNLQCLCKHSDEQMKSGVCASRQFFYEHCGQHPVIFVNFNSIECNTCDQFLSSIRNILNKTFEQHSYLKEVTTSRLAGDARKDILDYLDEGKKYRSLSKKKMRDGLSNLAAYLHKQFNRRVVILVDEFDEAVMQAIQNLDGSELPYMQIVKQFIGMMISGVMKDNKLVLGGLMNACILLITTLLPYAYQVQVYPFMENHCFSEFYGFTEEEVKTLLQMPQFRGFDEKGNLEYYNRYQFEGKSSKIYSVFPFAKYLPNWNEKMKNENDPNKKEKYRLQIMLYQHWKNCLHLNKSAKTDYTSIGGCS